MSFGATPADEGFFLPPDWGPHERSWLCWPHRRDLWGEELMAAKVAFAELARTIRRFEPVGVLARPVEATEARLACGPGIEIRQMDYEDAWLRDNGPAFLVDMQGHVAGVHWHLAGTPGRLARERGRDEQVGPRLLDSLGLHRFPAPLELAGGAFHADGLGTLLASEEGLFGGGRNPELTRQEVEALLATYLGVRRIVWLGADFVGPGSEGQIDRLCRFAGAGRVLLQGSRGANDPNRDVVEDGLARLQAARDARGRDLEVMVLPAPRRLPGGLSYTALCLANGAVLVPAFDDPADETAQAMIARAFPGREIVPVAAAMLSAAGGSLRRITLEQPRAIGQ
ncbi:MAG: agmatine deiminase family protein [Alphaproteobacteria bacterium]|nr:agmatine deiminase family protein [Alphaproteobacteria bacterium]